MSFLSFIRLNIPYPIVAGLYTTLIPAASKALIFSGALPFPLLKIFFTQNNNILSKRVLKVQAFSFEFLLFLHYYIVDSI